MKTLKMKAFVILLLSALFITSCRTEEEELITPDTEQTLVANSVLVDLLSRTSQNDGSVDNVLDNANCFTIQLPVTVFVNDLEIVVNSQDDFQTIEEAFDDFDGDVSTLEFQYPITIILADFTEVVINNQEELLAQAANCNGENEEDEDIECIDFQYPLTYSVFNTNDELIETVVVNNDEEHYAFLDSITEDDIVSINFPFTLILADGSTIVVNNIFDLEDALEAAIDACDEDDDNDYEDDDCIDCTTDDLLAALTGCDSFEVQKIKRDGDDFDNDYEDFRFQFFEDGSIEINDNSADYTGSWTAEGEGQNITVTIDVPEFPIFNDVWNLHQISAFNEQVKVDLRLGDDRLRFKCDFDNNGDNGNNGEDDDDCDDCTTDGLLTALTDCEDGFTVDRLERDDQDLEDSYEDLTIFFNEDGTVLVETSSASSTGTWSSSGEGNAISFVINIDISDIDDEWTLHAIEVEDDETNIDLRQNNGDRLKLKCN